MVTEEKILSRDELMTLVPAAFASSPSDKVSERYAFINTADIIDGLEDRGWKPVRATQNRRGDLLHGTHRITFRKADLDLGSFNVGDVRPELNLVNNHMAIKTAALFAGLWRKICKNGMVVAMGDVVAAVVVHRGDEAVMQIDEALNTAVPQLGRAAEGIAQWRQITLGPLAQGEFARQAGLIRGFEDGHFNPRALLTSRRSEDVANDLWTVFNRVQENVIRGGVRAVSNRRRLRGITNVAEDQRINTALWTLAENFAKKIRDGQNDSSVIEGEFTRL